MLLLNDMSVCCLFDTKLQTEKGWENKLSCYNKNKEHSCVWCNNLYPSESKFKMKHIRFNKI